jgi:16S rRNA (guanine(966)-N(2))-methyltransferase RsmD
MKEVRPTSGKLLLALMSILESKGKLCGCSFLDLFAGTGRVGIEALKRGAGTVYFVESIKGRAIEISNAIPCSYKDNSTVLTLELRRALSWLTKRELVFDVIFADPPYNEGWNKTLVPILEKNHLLLRDDGVFVYEHFTRENIDCETWRLMESRFYGESAITFITKENLK